MEAVQVTLGEVLLVLGSLAAVLFAMILLLLEAKVILHLAGQLNQGLKLGAPPPAGKQPLSQDRAVPDPGPEEERRDDAAR